MAGIPFLADEHSKRFLDGLVIEVQAYYGREALVAHHPELGGGCF